MPSYVVAAAANEDDSVASTSDLAGSMSPFGPFSPVGSLHHETANDMERSILMHTMNGTNTRLGFSTIYYLDSVQNRREGENNVVFVEINWRDNNLFSHLIGGQPDHNSELDGAGSLCYVYVSRTSYPAGISDTDIYTPDGSRDLGDRDSDDEGWEVVDQFLDKTSME
ncbi:hypothetical protein VTH06DRAFT_4390 [Thermothelomyces fergusii]